MITNFLKSEELATYKQEYKKLGLAVASLHSSYNEGEVNQMDYDVYYHSYSLGMAKIKRAIWNNDKSMAMSL